MAAIRGIARMDPELYRVIPARRYQFSKKQAPIGGKMCHVDLVDS